MKRNKTFLIIAIALFMGGILGWLLKPSSEETSETHAHAEGEEQVWTCSMHPQIRQPEPGDCPICGMDLIPLSEEQGMDADMFVMNENALKLANVRTMKVGEGEASRKLRLNGEVKVDERNSYTQSTHIPGRIEQLRVNFTGEKVNRGQSLAVIYSPAIVTAQEELLQAAEIRESQPELFEAAKKKLRNWKISEAQIQNMLNRGEPVDRFPITADVSGVVTELLADQGDYLERGMPIYEIANLDKVWVLFDLYESDLNWVKEGSTVEYTIQSIPGKTFEGTISFIDPLLNDNTRVATARIEVNNANGELKPGMFASGTVENNLQNQSAQLVIPETAVLWTGERSVVYVKKEAENGAGFQMREVTLGASLGDSYVVESGLESGEEIVVNGTFSVDAATQLAGRPSMMNPDLGQNTAQTMELSEKDSKTLMPVFMNYLELKNALVNDDFDSAANASEKLQTVAKDLDISALSAEVQQTWKPALSNLRKLIQQVSSSKDISAMRSQFDELSASMIALAEKTNPMPGMYVQHCPMADNNQGADWLSMSDEVRNPYYGASMLTCGEVTKQLK